MSDTLRLESIELRVRDLARSVAFYTALGFVVESQSDTTARLATDTGAVPLLTLTGRPGFPRAPRDAAGLFHAAMLLPSRAALGRWLQTTHARGIELEGFSDHSVSEAIYLSDPDGNGLEFYADRPRAKWPYRNGRLAMTTAALDLPGLLAESASLPPTDHPLTGARWGHLHLRVTALERSQAFYTDLLGMELVTADYPGARFLAADGYHHHVAINTWGTPRRDQPDESSGLAEAVFVRAGVSVDERSLRDPDGISLRIRRLDAAG
jgi:catechol 2,3-dioxygenase